MRKKSKLTKKERQKLSESYDNRFKSAPHSFVFARGNVGKSVSRLVKDFRKIMQPYTASRLAPNKRNSLKDFVDVAGVLNVSHFITFSKSESSITFRLFRMPHGPTMSFKILKYSLMSDVVESQKRPNLEPVQFSHHPLLVVNNLSGEGMHLKLIASMFQNLFPSIDIQKVKLADVRRCVLIDYDKESETIQLRHYNIRAVPVGLSKGVKKIVRSRVPDLGRFKDVSEYITRDGGNLSESEAEIDNDDSEVTLPQELPGRGNQESSKSALRLTEMGPRLTLQLIKIEDGLCKGAVLYHRYISKTEEELAEMKLKKEQKASLKARRKKEQEDNVLRKKRLKEEHRERSLAGSSKKQDVNSKKDLLTTETVAGDEDEDDDIDYYKKQVGETPDLDLLLQSKSQKRKSSTPPKKINKRQKTSQGNNKGKSSDFKSSKSKKEKRPRTNQEIHLQRKKLKLKKQAKKFKNKRNR